MYRVAIVEDEWESYESIQKCFDEYSKEYNEVFNIVHYKNGMDFIENYKANFDMIFMDVNMPQLNGLQAAAQLRQLDSKVVLIFVTFFAKYAIKGYAVDALDYVVKPVNYNTFKLKIQRAIEYCKKNDRDSLILPTSEGDIKIDLNSLDYIEIANHLIIYHTKNGNYQSYGTMREIEKLLPEKQFCKCNRCYLVNLRSVIKVEKNIVFVGSDQLVISRPRRQEFLDALYSYVMGG